MRRMYSGITQGLFTVSQVEKKPGLIHYTVKLNEALIQGLKTGASVNIDGVCQSVTAIHGHEVSFSAMDETLKLTTLKDLAIGRQVSVERSLRFGDEIGGHEIAGHVTGVAVVEQIVREPNNLRIDLRCPPEWMPYILTKGFIAVDGSSLTVGQTDPAGLFSIHLIPETIRLTHFGNKKIGDQVNIELDRFTQIIVSSLQRILNSVSMK
jgi:riboflavin synthase